MLALQMNAVVREVANATIVVTCILKVVVAAADVVAAVSVVVVSVVGQIRGSSTEL